MTATEGSGTLLSIAALFNERQARKALEQEDQNELRQKKAEELTAYKKRLDEFQVTDVHRQMVVRRLKGAFDRGETELMLTSFPSSLCTDGGRAVNNADVPPIVKASSKERKGEDRAPEWLATLPRGAHAIYEFWLRELQPGGFRFSARIINYPGGMPGDVGLFFSWPKSAVEPAN